MQELLQLENLCKQLYETADTNLRSEAEKALIQFAESPDCLSKCQLLLERGNVSSIPIKTGSPGLSKVFFKVGAYNDLK